MEIEDAIKHARDKVCGNDLCSQEHLQLALWLEELVLLRKQIPQQNLPQETVVETIET